MKAYDLTDDEALLLDGRVNAKAQGLIDAARQRVALRDKFAGLSDGEREFIVAATAEARKSGRLRKRNTSMLFCKCCGKGGGYAKRRRSGRGYRKGDPDYGRPLMIGGVSLAIDFVTMQGYPRLAACHDCYAKLAPLLQQELADVAAELPAELAGATRWTWNRGRTCKRCGWEGHEGEMGRRPTIFGDGTHPAICPNCRAENHMFQPAAVEINSKFALTRAAGSDAGSLK